MQDILDDFCQECTEAFVWVLGVVHVESKEVNLKMKLPKEDSRMLSQRY